MFPSGGATTLIFSVDGADAVISFVMRSKASWNLFVPLHSTSFGVQLIADVNVALYVALESCAADPVVCTWLVLIRRRSWKRQCWTTEKTNWTISENEIRIASAGVVYCSIPSCGIEKIFAQARTTVTFQPIDNIQELPKNDNVVWTRLRKRS